MKVADNLGTKSSSGTFVLNGTVNASSTGGWGILLLYLHLTDVVGTSVQVDQPQRSFLIPTIRFWMLQALAKRTDPDVTTWRFGDLPHSLEVFAFGARPCRMDGS